MYRQINAWDKRRGHQGLRWLGKEVAHILLSFLTGVALATAYHLIVMNHQVRTTAEAVCNVFGRDAEECKGGIDDVLNMSDEDIQNNMTIKGE